ncbi:HlyD family secretion protein [Barnesiella viscericola]|uniref:HlyD family secretion protein n=1 Tax=Barnesiella viscericola TaxID=397865 RepID=UPI0024B6AC78|nr:HlyD family secretion protein [Barnesiella viscericola]
MNRKTRRMIQHVVVLIILAIGIWWICVQFIKFNISTYTDNAQVRRHIVPVTARVQGYIKEVRFDEYSYVHKGDTLIIIEDREYQLKLAEAEAELQNAVSGKTVMSSAINTTENNIGVNEASILGTKAELDNAERDVKRYAALLETKAVTPKQYDDAKTHYERTKAEYDMLCRQKRSTLLTKAEQTQRLNQQDANIQLARVHKDYAALNVSYTVITAPTDGYTSKKTLQEGQFVQPGQTLLSIVDENDVWVVANYKETQTAHMKIGDRVRMTVDAIPGVEYIGAIEAISNATGAQYSIVPQDNATGNFVKVEQRIPVKIRLTKDNSEADLRRLRTGLNVECEMIE